MGSGSWAVRFLKQNRGLGTGQTALGFERREALYRTLAGHADFRRDVLKLALDRDAASLDAGSEP